MQGSGDVVTETEAVATIGHFSTAGVRPDRRLRMWNELCERIYAGTQVQSISPAYRGEMSYWELGDLTMVRPRSEASTVTRQAYVGAGRDRLILHLQHRGRSRHRYGSREIDLMTGDLTLCWADQGYRQELSDDQEILAVEFCGRALASRVSSLDFGQGTRVSGESAAARLLQDFLLSLWRQGSGGGVDKLWRDSVPGVFLDLVALAIQSPPTAAAATRTSRRDKALAFVAARLLDPDLDTTAIALHLGISARSVQAIFAEMATTPRRHCMEMRLRRAADILSVDRHKTVTSIAHELGFSDAAHFARCFRGRFGFSPRDWRSRA